MALCGDCKVKSDKWLDYRQPVGLKIASGAAYDDSARGVAANRQSRFENWRNLIRDQQAAIKRICEEDHQGGQS